MNDLDNFVTNAIAQLEQKLVYFTGKIVHSEAISQS